MSHALRGVMWWAVCARFVVGFICAGVLPSSPALLVVVPPFWAVGSLSTNQSVPRFAQTPTFPALPINTKQPTEPASATQNEPIAENASASFSLPRLLLVVWLGGFLVRTLVSVAQYARLQKRIRLARTVTGTQTDAPAAALFHRASDAARQMNQTVLPRLLLSPTPCDPLVTGWRKPIVLLSEADVSRLSPQELTLVLLHEMAHLKRGDLLWGIVPHLALHLFWFWPLAHVACREWGLSCEAACDTRAALAAQTSPHVYGELLLKLGTASQAASPFFAALPVSVPFRLLQRRLLMLNSSFSTAPVPRRRRIISLLGTTALLAIAVPLALLPLHFAAAGDTPAYTKINGDTDKPWSSYPDGPRNLNFSNGLSDWHQVKGNQKDGYTISVKNVTSPTVGPSAVLRAASSPKNKEGFLVQYARPAAFRGKRVRFSGWVKTENARSAGFWLRMDTPTWQQAWNQLDAPLSGNGDWVKLEYVFDVPNDAQGWAFGTNLHGNGTIWLHAPHFEIVDKTVSVSFPAFDSSPEGIRTFGQDIDNPTNLDFKSGLLGWWNDNPQHNAEKGYAIGLDADGGRVPGQKAAYLKSISASPKSYGTLAQNTQAINLRGKRVRYSVSLKT